MKALIIDEPWIGKILRGEKTWEMRKTACHRRGRIALIRKGSGMIVGTADLVDSLAPIETKQAYSDTEKMHAIPPERQEAAFADGWTVPWVLANARPLPSAVVYRHPFGAVIWVNLDEDAIAVLTQQMGASGSQSPPASQKSEVRMKPVTPAESDLEPSCRSKPGPAVISPRVPTRRVVVTGGNVRNNHIYLPLDFFPDDAIGGANRAAAAPRTIHVTFQPGITVETDIDKSKRILRKRGPVGDFLARACVNKGDVVLITRHSTYEYTISKLCSGS